MDMNVLKLPMPFRYYVRHPLRFLHYFSRSLKNAKLRIVKGWCPNDVWEMYMWLGTVLPDMLRYLADKCMGYPGDNEFSEPNKWTDWLNSVADILEYAASEDGDENEYCKLYHQIMVSPDSSTLDKIAIKDKFLRREEEIGFNKQLAAEDAMDQLGKNFFRLWD